MMSDLKRRIHDLNGFKLLADKAERKFLMEKERLIEDFLKSNNLDKLCKRKSDGRVGKLVSIPKAEYISDSVKFYPIKKDGELSKNSSGFLSAFEMEDLFKTILKDFEPVPVTE